MNNFRFPNCLGLLVSGKAFIYSLKAQGIYPQLASLPHSFWALPSRTPTWCLLSPSPSLFLDFTLPLMWHLTTVREGWDYRNLVFCVVLLFCTIGALSNFPDSPHRCSERRYIQHVDGFLPNGNKSSKAAKTAPNSSWPPICALVDMLPK